MKGYLGRALHVDLSTGSSWDEKLSDEVLRSFIGGIGVGTYLLLSQGGSAPRTASANGTAPRTIGPRNVGVSISKGSGELTLFGRW